jgi:hypothetical protein
MKYKIGYDDPSPLFRDVGSGVWNSEPSSLTAKAQRLFILGNIGSAAVVVGRHAAAHLSHYFANNGMDYFIDLRGLVNDHPDSKTVFDGEVKEAIKFAESLPPGEAQITSTKASASGILPTDSKDWFYAVGAYQAWGKAKVSVPPANNKPRLYWMDFEYCFFDQYNWNGDGSVTLCGKTVSDKDMGLFHKMGIAKEYEMRGSFHVSVEWPLGTSPTVTVPTNLQLAGIGKAIGL